MTIVEEIKKLKEEKDAVILAHYYVRPEVQEIADYIGDSFYLSKVATKLKEQTIVFCGVSFMGESAKILNPKKTVLMPDMNADCPMAHMATPEQVAEVRAGYDDLAVVCYVLGRFSKPGRDVTMSLAVTATFVGALAVNFLPGSFAWEGFCGLGLHLSADGFRGVYGGGLHVDGDRLVFTGILHPLP